MSMQDLTLLKLAECGDFSGLHLYLEQNSNVNVNYQSDKDGTNALIACVKGSNILPASESSVEFVSCGRLLVESGTDINAQDIGGRTALHWAVSSNNVKFVENLLEAGADTTLFDENGDAVIHLALSTKETKCLQAICGHISTLAIEQPNKHGMNPLVLAVQNCEIPSVEILLDCGAQVNAQNQSDEGKTAAHYAVLIPDGASVLKVLLRYDADVSAQTADGSSVLFLASGQRNPASLRLLIDEKGISQSQIDHPNHLKKTPLMNACQKGLFENVKILTDAGADLSLQDVNGLSCLWYAVESKNMDCVPHLLTKQPSVGKLSDKDGRVPLQLAIFEGSQDMVAFLIQYSNLSAKDSEGHNCIHWATACGKAYLIEMLAEAGADIEAVDIHGARPLHYAANLCTTSLSHLGLECTMALLKRKAKVDCRDKGSKTPLLWAASQGADEYCKLLLNAGADVLAKDNDGLTALHYATSCNHPTFMELLVRDFNCPSNTVDSRGRTALYYAIKGDLSDAIKVLLKHGADASWQDGDGNSPAHLAASLGFGFSLQLLQQFGGNLELRNKKGMLPIHEAQTDSQTDALTFLLHVGCDINVSDEAGRTPLHLAASSGSLLACSKLIDAGADVNVVYQNEKGHPVTALDCALSKSSECSKLLEMKGSKKGEELYLPVLQVEEQVTDEVDAPTSTKNRDVTEAERMLKERKKGKENNNADNNVILQKNMKNTENMDKRMLHQNNNNSTEDELKSTSSMESTGVKMELNGGGSGDPRQMKEQGQAADILHKISNWSEYEKEQTSLFDALLGTTSSSLAEQRAHAKTIKAEMLEDLKKLKKRHDENIQKFKDGNSNIKSQETSQELESIQNRAGDVMKRLQSIQTASSAKHLPAEKKVKKKKTKRKSFGGRESEMADDDDDDDEDDLDLDLDEEDARKSRHTDWLVKKNKEYIRKKEAVRPKSCPKLDPEVVAATIGMKAMWQESHEYKMKRVLSVTRNRPPNVPDYIRSPYSNRTTGECGLYRAYSTKDTNDFYHLHGTEVALRHRQRGSELNRQIYPKSWQISEIGEAENKQGEIDDEEVYDLKACYSPRWDGKFRPRNPLRFHSSSSGRSSSSLKPSCRQDQLSS